jgi:hypothetical protein
VQQFELVVDLKAAKVIGLTPPTADATRREIAARREPGGDEPRRLSS